MNIPSFKRLTWYPIYKYSLKQNFNFMKVGFSLGSFGHISEVYPKVKGLKIEDLINLNKKHTNEFIVMKRKGYLTPKEKNFMDNYTKKIIKECLKQKKPFDIFYINEKGSFHVVHEPHIGHIKLNIVDTISVYKRGVCSITERQNVYKEILLEFEKKEKNISENAKYILEDFLNYIRKEI